jgi:hypothetical protein
MMERQEYAVGSVDGLGNVLLFDGDHLTVEDDQPVGGVDGPCSEISEVGSFARRHFIGFRIPGDPVVE